MLVQHIVEDLKSIFKEHPQAEEYGIAFASYLEDGSGQIQLQEVEAFEWDDDDEFFLIPTGSSKHYGLKRKNFTGKEFLEDLACLDEGVMEFVAYARAKIKVAKDGSVASLNSPLWGTGYHQQARLVYFYHGNKT